MWLSYSVLFLTAVISPWEATEFGVVAEESQADEFDRVAAYDLSKDKGGEVEEDVLPSESSEDEKDDEGKRTKKALEKRRYPRATNSLLKFNQEGLKWHNQYRNKHGVPPLKHSAKLQQFAQEWAEHLARTNSFDHRTGNKYGENLYAYSSSKASDTATAQHACKSWYKEIRFYTFGKRDPANNQKTGHFTQMIWKGTQLLGMGFARSRSGRQIIVAEYYPPGNFRGQYAENVPKPRN